jgi:serine O-acetyltransferase
MNKFTLYKFIIYISSPRTLLHFAFFYVIDSQTKQTMMNDINRWCTLYGRTGMFDCGNIWFRLNSLMYMFPEFRNLFYYRIGKQKSKIKKVMYYALRPLLKIIFKPIDTLYILCPDIGGGLFIQHGFSTIVSAKKIGSNCWINQQVTIGYSNDTDYPTIGDNVTINAGAIIIGSVNVGNNSKIGAGTVVVKDVPSNCTIVGAQAWIVRKNGNKIRERL